MMYYKKNGLNNSSIEIKQMN